MKKQLKCLARGLAALTLALFIGDFCRGQSQNEIAYYNTPAVMPNTAREKNQELEQGINLFVGTQVVFASVGQARKTLTVADQYINSFTSFDRQVRLNSPGGNLEQLITQELFHIFTKNNLKTRKALYNAINFKRCEEKTELPKKLLDIEITNPDVPTERYYVEVEHEGENIKVVPMITMPNFDASKNRSFFSYLKLELVEVERAENSYSYVRKEGDEPVVFTVQELSDYFKKIGENTSYVIHPEEILADNFALMVMGSQPLKSNSVIDKMKDQLGNKKSGGVGIN